MKLFIYFILLFFCISCSSDKQINNQTTNEDLGFFKDDWTFEFFMIESEKNVFRLWLPSGVKPKAILVLAPGNAADGTSLVNIDHWREYAKEEELALLGVFVRSDLEGASSRLLKSIEIISKHNGLENMSNLPLLLRGFSHGGRFSYTFSKLYKNKVLAYANIKGSVIDLNEKLPPGLFIVGGEDNILRNESIKKAFLAQRNKGAVACFAFEQDVGHDEGNSNELVKPFFKSVLKKSLVNGELIEINQQNIFLGDNLNFDIYEYSNYPNDKTEASCIIDLDYGNYWKGFMK